MLKFVTVSVFLIVANSFALCSKLEPIRHIGDNGNLQNDLNDFLNIIPVDDIRNLTKFFYANDAEMRESYDYLRDDGYKLVVENLSKLSLVKKFTTFLNDTGVNFAELVKRVEKIVLTSEEEKSIVGNCWRLIDSVAAIGANLIHLILFFSFFSQLVNENDEDNMGGMNAFFTEALSLIPQDEVLSLFFAKMEESNAFSTFLEKLNASDYENLTESLKVRKALVTKDLSSNTFLSIVAEISGSSEHIF